VSMPLSSVMMPYMKNLDENRLKSWVEGARSIAPNACDWTGVYFFAWFVGYDESDDLILGPFIGAKTEHTRIPVLSGLCGLAMREERVVNIDDVSSSPEYLACSLETKSELIIPLYFEGKMVGQLDIDSHSTSAFTPEIEEKMKIYCGNFEDYMKEPR